MKIGACLFALCVSLLSTGLAAREFSAYEQRVLQAYLAYYGRPADPGGLQFWSNRLRDEGGDLNSIIDAFGESQEYQQRFGSLSNTQLVTNLYQQLFGRDPDAGGLNFYVGKLESGEWNLQKISLVIFDGVQGDDVDIVNNRLDFSEYYVSESESDATNPVTAEDLAGLMNGIGASSASLDLAYQQFEARYRRYDRAYWEKVLDEIEQGDFATDDFLYAVLPNVDQCDPGVLTAAAKTRALAAVNQTRALHNLPVLEYDSSLDTQMQEASLVQRANNYLSHFPAATDACYTAAAAEGSSSSNLSLASRAMNIDPVDNIVGWTNDKNNVSVLMAAGHRRWILYPELGYFSYGQVHGAAVQKTFGFGLEPSIAVSADLEYVAMPYRTYPYILVSKGDKPTPWSISMLPFGNASSSFDYFDGARVGVTETASGTALTVGGLYTDTQGIGLRNFLSWMVDGWEYDTEYRVTISNIQMPGGELRTIEYPVLLDYFNLFSVEEPLEPSDSQTAGRLSGEFNTSEDKDSYSVSLSGSTSFAGASEFSNQAFFILLYDERKRLIRSSDVAFEISVPTGRYTVIASPCDENGICYQNVRSYTIDIN